MKTLMTLALLLVLGVVSFQLAKLYSQKTGLAGRLEKVQEKIAALSAENAQTENDLEYYENTENLSKELKAKFDYKRPGEELFILIPKQ